MKIAHVVSTYPPYRGGMGNVAHELVEQQRQRGHEVTVLTPSQMHPWLRYGNAALMPQLLWKVRGFDVVHLHWPFIGGAEFVLLYFLAWRIYSGILKNVRTDLWRSIGITGGAGQQNLVVTYHMDLVGSGALAIFFRAYQWVMVSVMRRVATFVTVASLDYAEHSRWLRGWKYLVEVPFGVDARRFFKSHSPIRANRRMVDVARSLDLAWDDSGGVRTDGCTALFVSALDRAHYFKGLDVLFAAWKQVRHFARLRIIGDGDFHASYERQARELGISNNVEFVGAVPWQELPAMYQSADFLVFPSIDASEAFGLVILEAAASGLPAIVSNLPGVRTLIKEGETGLIVSPGDVSSLLRALRKFIADAESRQVMGAAARDRVVQKYSWDATLDALEWTYRLKSNPIDKLGLVAIRGRKVLMAKSRGHAHWFIPGGKRDPGESDREALTREVQEEVGVTLDGSSIRYFGSYTVQANDKPQGIFVRGTCYIAQFVEQPRASNEIEAVEYMGYDRKSAVGNLGQLLFDDLKRRDLIDEM